MSKVRQPARTRARSEAGIGISRRFFEVILRFDSARGPVITTDLGPRGEWDLMGVWVEYSLD